MTQKMKSSEKITLWALAAGAACCFCLKLFASFHWLPAIVVSVLFAGAAYRALLQMGANESIVDSKTINQK